MKISVKSDEYEIIYELNDSRAAEELYNQLPLTTEVEPFSNNEMTFYPEKLSTEDAPLPEGNRAPSLTMNPGETWSCFMRHVHPTAVCMNWEQWFQGKNLSKT